MSPTIVGHVSIQLISELILPRGSFHSTVTLNTV